MDIKSVDWNDKKQCRDAVQIMCTELLKYVPYLHHYLAPRRITLEALAKGTSKYMLSDYELSGIYNMYNDLCEYLVSNPKAKEWKVEFHYLYTSLDDPQLLINRGFSMTKKNDELVQTANQMLDEMLEHTTISALSKSSGVANLTLSKIVGGKTKRETSADVTAKIKGVYDAWKNGGELPIGKKRKEKSGVQVRVPKSKSVGGDGPFNRASLIEERQRLQAKIDLINQALELWK